MSRLIIKDIYPKHNITRHDLPTGRVYETPHGHLLPSVTTILSATSDNSGLDSWVKRVGVEQAEKIKNDSANFGSFMHQTLENYINNMVNYKVGPLLSRMMADLIIKNYFSDIDEVWGIEFPLYYPFLYAGTTDLVCVYKGNPCIVDFKNSRSMKKREYVENYYMQLAAYALAFEMMYGTPINHGAILIATQDLKPQTFESDPTLMDSYKKKWLASVDSYHAKRR
jgi:genome maintenance exonuclease 1